MDNDNFETLWKEFDTKETDDLGLEKSNLCERMLKIVEGKRKEEIQLELNLLWFTFSAQRILESVEDVDTAQLSEYTQRFVEKCDENSFEYYKKRFSETKSLLNKWHYSFACWSIKKESEFIENSISLLIYCSLNNMQTGEPIDTVNLLMTAYSLSNIYNFQKFEKMISDAAVKIFFNFEDTEDARWMIEPAEIFASIDKTANLKLVNDMITALHKEAKRFFEKRNHHLHQSLLETSIELYDLLNLNPQEKTKKKTEIFTKIAESNEDDARIRLEKGEGLGAVVFFEKAQKIYQQIGNAAKVSEISDKIREASQKIEWKTVEAKFELPKLELEGKTGYEFVKSICKFKEMIPKKDNTEKLAKEMIQKNPISSMFSATHFNRYGPVGHSSDEESVLKAEIMRLSIQTIKLGEHWLSSAVKKLENEKKVTIDDFIHFISDYNLHNNDSLQFIRSGVEHHFRGDYVASIHVLTPQIEKTLRTFLKSKGISTLRVQRGFTMETELGGLLKKQDVMNLLGEDFADYLKIKFSENGGINLRNDVSHALLPPKEFDYPTSLSIIYTIMRISSMAKS
ncbi:MAG: DUF4209 domain-containing protein [Nitrosopumilaceae archaeon]